MVTIVGQAHPLNYMEINDTPRMQIFLRGRLPSLLVLSPNRSLPGLRMLKEEGLRLKRSISRYLFLNELITTF